MSRPTPERLEMLRAMRGDLSEDAAHDLWAEIDALRQERDEWKRCFAATDGLVGDYQAYSDSLTARVRELETEVKETESEEQLLRKLLWLRHGCPVIQLYGDDGEMQCGTCGIDFVRATAETIQSIWRWTSK